MKMKNIFLFLFVIASFSVAQAQSVNLESSSVEWVGKKITGTHSGTISLQSADLTVDNGMIKGGTFVMDMNSIVCTDLSGKGAGKLEGHLKSDDFFGVEAFPTATLVITDVNKAGLKNELTVTGDLTLKGETKSISFPASVSGNKAEATIFIDRTKFGIKYGSGSFFDNLGDKAIDNMFELRVALDLTPA
jgi:polyisoprenoid-binding protein YceI